MQGGVRAPGAHMQACNGAANASVDREAFFNAGCVREACYDGLYAAGAAMTVGLALAGCVHVLTRVQDIYYRRYLLEWALGAAAAVVAAAGGSPRRTPHIKRQLAEALGLGGVLDSLRRATRANTNTKVAFELEVEKSVARRKRLLGDRELAKIAIRAHVEDAAKRFGGMSNKLDKPVNVRFENLGLVHNLGGKVVLKGIFGRFLSGELGAIMGPSGCGKSTLLSLLAGIADWGTMTGSLLVNERPAKPNVLRKVCAFVPQDDVVFETLTVRENLIYQALLRMPKRPHGMTGRKDANEIVNHIIHVLKLENVAHAQIGSYGISKSKAVWWASKKGTRVGAQQQRVSGGQRKRVSIGFELCADPTLLLADEPTSGLDATVSYDLLCALDEIASTLFLNIVTVIHQPRYSIFCLLDTVMLLGLDGGQVYCGPASRALSYFQGYLGFPCPPKVNPPDFFLDVISGDVHRPDDPDFVPTDLYTFWQLFHADLHDERARLRKSPLKTTVNDISSVDLDRYWNDVASERHKNVENLHEDNAQHPYTKQEMRPEALLNVRTAVETALQRYLQLESPHELSVINLFDEDGNEAKEVEEVEEMEEGKKKKKNVLQGEHDEETGCCGVRATSSQDPQTRSDPRRSSLALVEVQPLPSGITGEAFFERVLKELSYEPKAGDLKRMARIYDAVFESIIGEGLAATKREDEKRKNVAAALLHEIRVRAMVRTIGSAEWAIAPLERFRGAAVRTMDRNRHIRRVNSHRVRLNQDPNSMRKLKKRTSINAAYDSSSLNGGVHAPSMHQNSASDVSIKVDDGKMSMIMTLRSMHETQNGAQLPKVVLNKGPELHKVEHKSVARQVMYQMERALVLEARKYLERAFFVVLHIVSAGSIAVVYLRPMDGVLPGAFLMAHLAFALIDVVFVVFMYSTEKAQIAREVRSGASHMAYWIARNLLLLFDNVGYSMVSSAALSLFCRLNLPFRSHWWLTFLLSFFSTSMGQFFNFAFESAQNAIVVACVVVLLLGGVLSGANPPLAELEENSVLFKKYWGLPAISFSRWSVEAAAMDEWESRDLPKAQFDALLSHFGYEQRDYWTCYGWLIIAGTVLRLLSLWWHSIDMEQSFQHAVQKHARQLLRLAGLEKMLAARV